MFKIARIAKQILNTARNIQQTASVSINSMMKYCSQSKGYIEDVADEFYFESFSKILPKQSVTKDQFKVTTCKHLFLMKRERVSTKSILPSPIAIIQRKET